MMVKSTNGTDFNAAGRGTTALSIIGTALGGLAVAGQNNGLLGGLFNNVNAEYSPYVTERKFYETEIANLKESFAQNKEINDRICALEQRVAVDETSISKNFDFMSAQNDWQNKFYDEKFRYADLLEQCRISDATCRCIKGDVYASPSQLADPYSGGLNIISTRRAYPTFGYEMYNDCGYGWGYNSGCGCGYNF